MPSSRARTSRRSSAPTPDVFTNCRFRFVETTAPIVRGAIDVLVQYGDGRIEVLEFKTGHPQSGHERQLALYVAAARAMFPGANVAGRVIYGAEQLSVEPASK